LLAVSINLGVIEITKLKYGDVEAVIRNLSVIRLFLTLASVGSAVAVLYAIERDKIYAATTEFLALEKQYHRAIVESEFIAWSEKVGNTKSLRTLFILQSVTLALLLVVLPIATLIYSVCRG